MNNRQKELTQEQLNSEKKTIDELKQVYSQALKDVEEKIRELSSRTDMENLQSIIYQKQYQEALKGQLEGVLANLQSNQYATVSQYITECYQNGYLGVMYDLQGQGIPLIMPIDQEQVTKAIQIDSKLSKSLYSSMGEDVNKLKTAVRAQVSRGIANGSTWNQIAATLANRNMQSTIDQFGFKKAMNNAVRIARTEGHRVQNQAALDAQYKAKEKGADIVKQWDSTLDGRTRDTHRELDGQIREVDEDFEVEGKKAPAPSMFGYPEEDINCRCCLLQRARWALDDGFTKMDNLTKEIKSFDSPASYDEFKKDYWSNENIKYMNYVTDMEDKYKTKDFEKVLGSMSDIEFNHYQKLLSENPFYKSDESEIESGVTKSLDIDDFEMFASSNDMLEETTSLIYSTIKEFEKNGGMYISESHFGEFYDEETGSPALFQVFTNPYGLVEINVNSAIMGGKTISEIDEMIKNTIINLPQNLKEAVIHECGHAKAYYRKKPHEVKEMNEKLKDKGVEGISVIAANDGAECIAEVEVLLYRGEEVPEEAMSLYKEWVK